MTRKRHQRAGKRNRDQQGAFKIGLRQMLLIGVLAVPVIYGWIYAVEIRNADASLRTGLDYLQSGHPGKYDNAVLWLQRAAKGDPANKTALYYLAAAYREGGNAEKAVEICERLLQRDPNFIQARFHLGLLLLGRREFARAAEQFAAHIHTNSMYWQSYYGLGYCHSELKRPGEAIAALEEIDRIHQIRNLPIEKYLEVKKLLYMTYREAGNTEGARRTLEIIKKLQSPG